MKHEKTDAVEVCKELEDVLAPRLKLSVLDRAVYSHLLRHSRFEGKHRLRFSILWLAHHPALLRGGRASPSAASWIRKSCVWLSAATSVTWWRCVCRERSPQPATVEWESAAAPSYKARSIWTSLISCEHLLCAGPSTHASMACASTACAGLPAGRIAWTTWCLSHSPEAIRTATSFPAASTATPGRATSRPRIFCASFSARGACRPRTSAHAWSPCRRSQEASSAHPSSAERTQEEREAQRIKGQRKALRPLGPRPRVYIGRSFCSASILAAV